jgi:molecular chaperone HtpG
LRDKIGDDENRQMCGNLLSLLLETSLINAGFTLDDPSVFSQRMYNMVCLGLGLEQDVEEEPVAEPVAEPAAEPAPDTTETPTTDAPQNVEETTTDGNTETTEDNLESTTDNNDEMEQVD